MSKKTKANFIKKIVKTDLFLIAKNVIQKKQKNIIFENKNKILAVCKLYRIENHEKVKKAKINSMNKKPLEYREKERNTTKKTNNI